MQRCERVYRWVCSQAGTGVTAQEVAEQLGITRANASNDLNALVKASRLVKQGKKPVLFSLGQKQNGLSAFAEQNPSLKTSVEQAQAAVLYPAARMHILLSGETGVGKSMFAEFIYRFAKEQGRIREGGILLTFNCADYANNPQLILSQLFGVVAGSYTGATESRAGLVEAADGGILFLDEVHRLPPEAQEMLFTFIDRQVFHRLGETTFSRRADVQLICATTEDIASSLLATFTRRIPMKIYLPSLTERGLEERFTLIQAFLDREARELKRQIEVSKNAIRGLLSYPCVNNIGQLKTDIQLLCAQSYARSLANGDNQLRITSRDLPPYIRDGFYSSKQRSEIWQLMAAHNQRFLVFHENTREFLPRETPLNDLYQLIDTKIADMEKIGLDNDSTIEIVDLAIQDFFAHLAQQNGTGHQQILTLVGSEILTAAKDFLKGASHNIQSPLTNYDSLVAGLALHLHNLVERSRLGRPVVNPKLQDIKAKHPNEYQLAQKQVPWLESELSIKIPESEVGFLTLFLLPQEQEINQKVKVLVVAHGESTATSMAAVANELLENQAVTGFNMPLQLSPKHMLEEVKSYLQQIKRPNILILTDMGSLTNFATELMVATPYQVRCVDLVSTLHVLEASRKANLGYTLEELVAEMKRISQGGVNQSQLPKTTKKQFIVTACTTGQGSARLIMNLLKNQLNLHEAFVEIRTFQITDEAALQTELQQLKQEGKILAQVSTFPVSGIESPYFSLNQTFDAKSLEKLQAIIDFAYATSLAKSNLAPMIQSLDGEVLLENVLEWILTVERELELNLTPEIKVGLLCHLATRIDQLHEAQQITEPLSQFQNHLEQQVYHALRSLELIYRIQFTEADLAHLLAYLCKKVLV